MLGKKRQNNNELGKVIEKELTSSFPPINNT